MKKILLLIAISLVSVSAFAAHGPAGCGLGSVLFKDQKGLVMNVLAATFNGSSGNQTFGMSTGTLGCEDAATAKVAAASFVEGNMVALSNDIARGQGQTLDAYISLLSVEKVDYTKLQSNYSTIFALGNDANKVHNKILSIING